MSEMIDGRKVIPNEVLFARIEEALDEHGMSPGELLDALDKGAAILRDHFLWRKAGRPYELVDGKPEPSNVEPGDLELSMEELDAVRIVFQEFRQSNTRRAYSAVVQYLEGEFAPGALATGWKARSRG